MAPDTPFLTDDMKRQTIGLETIPVSMEVEKGHIARFAEAIEDANPLYIDEAAARRNRHGGIIAPPTFLRSMRRERLDMPFDSPFKRFLDGGSQWEYFEPVRVGDLITSVNRVTDISERQGRLGTMIFLTTVTTYTNQLDQVVATQTGTMISY